MTRSQTYAIERSKELKVPIVLFDEAEVAMVLCDPTTLPVLPRAPKGWKLDKTIELDTHTADAVDQQLLSMVQSEDATYGFAVVGGDEEKLELGIFQRAPKNATVVEEVFKGRVRRPAKID